jgi:hypothetical protein
VLATGRRREVFVFLSFFETPLLIRISLNSVLVEVDDSSPGDCPAPARDCYQTGFVTQTLGQISGLKWGKLTD